MHGEKHIDRYPHRTSPMDKYKHEFKKSKSRLLLENTIPLSPCSFLVALFNIERSSILLRSDRTLSRLDDKRLHVLRTNVWQKLGGDRETVWHIASLHSKRFRASSSRKLGREQKKKSSITRLETLATQASIAQAHNRSFFLWE